MSKCNYHLQCITVTKEIIAKIERLLFQFLWNEKNEKIKRKQLTQNYKNGGIRIEDIKTQLQTFRIKWVNRLILDNDMNRKIIPIMQQYWVTKFNLSSSKEYWSQVYTSFFNDLTNNKLIEFRFKLISSILPCKELVLKLRLSDNPLWEVCHIQENYHHMFIECPVIQQLWVQIEN